MEEKWLDLYERDPRRCDHDELTGLPNRRFFMKRLGQAIANARRKKQMLSVMFLDLDRFKLINGTLGHGMGDLLLQEVAERLKRCIWGAGTVSRMGGDEFIILLPGFSAPEDAARMAERILEGLASPFELEGQEYFISASIGISLYPADGMDGETLVRHADTAMYHAKEQRIRYQFFTSSMDTRSLERLKLENDLRRALERQEFLLHYQPQADLRTGKISGVEALVRWRHPKLGVVTPLKFIPLAEETGLILPLGEWVLRTACRQNKMWQDAGIPPVRIAVNLSIFQCQQKNLPGTIFRVLQESGLPPCLLELEVTESGIMRNPEATIRVLQELKEMGIRITLDDFGTGYSSLNYLKRLPIDTIKIDRSFVRNLATNREDTAIVKTVIALAHSLQLEVIGEGVETEEQVHVLRSFQCDGIQGCFFSPPLPAEEVEKLFIKLW